MRGWWSARSRAKIWDSGAAPTAAPRPSPQTEPEPVPQSAAPEVADAAIAPAEPVEALLVPEPLIPEPPIPEPVEAPAATEAAVEPVAAVTPPEPVAPPEPAAASPTRPLAALFDPRPDDFLPRETPVSEVPGTPVDITIAESPFYHRASVGVPDGAPESSPEPEQPAPAASTPAPILDSQGEFLRLLEVVTSMCDHVIEYIEADRAERRQMMEMLTQLGRVITEGSAAAVAAFTALSNAQVTANAARPIDVAAAPTPEPVDPEPRERIIGGSMPAGPEPHVDLVGEESTDDPSLAPLASAKIHIAVEVRGQFGDRWVDGFEICEVMTTASGPRYRLRRQRDGVVLPELFDATNIRHVATDDDSTAEDSTAESQASRERSMDSHPSGSNGDSAPVNGSGYWSRS